MSLFVALASPTATPTSHHPLSYHPSQPTLKKTQYLWLYYSFWQIKEYISWLLSLSSLSHWRKPI